MATAEQIAEVREYIDEPDDTDGWTSARIGVYIDREDGDLYLGSSAIWSAKAASYARLVNVSESGSSRSLGTLMDNALKMAALYKGKSPTAAPAAGVIVLQHLVRP